MKLNIIDVMQHINLHIEKMIELTWIFFPLHIHKFCQIVEPIKVRNLVSF
jgi:hypothetical protein